MTLSILHCTGWLCPGSEEANISEMSQLSTLITVYVYSTDDFERKLLHIDSI